MGMLKYTSSLLKNFIVSFTSLMLFSGCTVYRAPEINNDYYWINPTRSPGSVVKVVLVELENESPYPQITIDLMDTLYHELQKRQLFGIQVLRKSDPAYQALQLNMNSTFNDTGRLKLIRETLNCDAIMLGKITKYYPYPHMSMGLCLKLTDLRDGQLLWALDGVWDTDDKATEYQMKHFYREQKPVDFPDLRGKLLNVSSLEFIKFVAYQVSATLK